MMYSEFIDGTGCRDNEHNQKVFKDLEILYMNSDLTKETIYEYGKKLVNNDLTEGQKRFNQEVREACAALKIEIEDLEGTRSRYKEYARDSFSADDRKYWNREAHWMQEQIQQKKEELRWKKSCIIK